MKRAGSGARPSRDGHEFHEAWTARKALQLVFPPDDFVGMAVEGLSPEDEQNAAPASVEVADLVLFYGKKPDFAGARNVAVLQFKYSIRNRHTSVRVADAKQTIEKFAASYLDHKKRHGAKNVSRKLSFEFVTNRPIDTALQEAIAKIATQARPSHKAKAYADQFKAASGLSGTDLIEFAGKVRFIGLTGSLQDSKSDLSRTLADWSATSTDALSQARLGKLRELVRDKAGTKGAGRNLILRTDVFAALGISGIEDLLPSPESFPNVGKVVEREQLGVAQRILAKAKRPFLIHAGGGIGKTVFIQSLAKTFSVGRRAILFDCFGGGAYRAPEDARHLPRKGLVHIANLLASEGICDPLLPGHDNADEIIRHFRMRLAQAVNTLRRASPKTGLVLFLDAIDNAALQARDRDEDSFPQLLLESWRVSGPVDGVQLVISCRTEPERRDLAVGSVPCEDLELKPFTRNEAAQYLKARVKNLTVTELEVACARSQGNPRILKHLAEGDRGLLEESEIGQKILLDDLITSRIYKALEEASAHGYSEETIKAFLAGLAVLPPPVPIKEYADAHGMSNAAIQSFSADLYPLLERTRHGLIFRDEPTETLVRRKYGDDLATLSRIADNLYKKQGESTYAAAALPGLLQKIDAGDLLFKLALDDTFPAAIKSDVGKREIRYARLKAASRHAASKNDFDKLVHLLVELSAIAAVKQRGTTYIRGNPALVVASEDVDAMRRLFEMRTKWPGTRHARLAIANILSDDIDEAQRHVLRVIEWINHAWQQDPEKRRETSGPEILDLVSVPLCRIVRGETASALRVLSGLQGWAAFEVTEKLLPMLEQAERAGVTTAERIREFRSGVTSNPGVIAAFLSFRPERSASTKKLVTKLAAACKRKGRIKRRSEFGGSRDVHEVDSGLEISAAIAILNGLHDEARKILGAISTDHPSSWTYTEDFPDGSSGAFVRRAVLAAVATRKPLADRAVLPKELMDVGKSIGASLTGEILRKVLQQRLDAQYKAQPPGEDGKNGMGYEDKRRMEVFLNHRMERLLRISRAFEDALSAAAGRADRAFIYLLDVWSDLAKRQDEYTDRQYGRMFFDVLARSLIMFCLRVRDDLKAASIKTAVTRIEMSNSTYASNLVDLISILARRPAWYASIDAAVAKARKLIETDDDVSHRGSMFARLAEALLPASKAEAGAYFTLGLKEVDAFGSDDYYYTNDLLHFTATLRGDELSEQDFHTLSNFCEMNMASEERKFPWFSFAQGMAAAAGPRMLAKLGRWDDRDKISLEYTLLPYLTALIESRKISPEVALGLMQLTDAAELYVCGTGTFAAALHKNAYPNEKALFQELLRQFSGNNPGIPSRSAAEELQKLAAEVFGSLSPEATHLSAAAPQYHKLIDEQNDHQNYHPKDERISGRDLDKEKKTKRRVLKAVARRTSPANEASMIKAIDALNNLQNAYEVKDEFLDAIRSKVAFPDRANYIRIVASMDRFYYYWRLHELGRCREQWGASPALAEVFRELAVPFIQINFDNFIRDETFSGSMLKELSDFTGVAYPELAAELVKVLTKSDRNYSAAIWMALAAVVNERARAGEAQTALHRLLTGNAVRLTTSVTDGPYRPGLYPAHIECELAAALTWLKLGSPSAPDRWRAAHAVRSFARMGRWDVIDAVVSRWSKTTADEFQAPELKFYFLHARLWLLISVARLALDEPAAIAKYQSFLVAAVKDTQQPHVLMRQFAADALKACLSAGSLTLSSADSAIVASVNSSPFARVSYKRASAHADRAARPKARTQPKDEFGLEYDFEKYDVSNLATAFGRAPSEVDNAITRWVRRFDKTVRAMYESGGRSSSSSRGGVGLVSHFHVYGQYLGWTCISFAAAEFLAKYKVHEGYLDEDSWVEWLRRRLLTRPDGLWLADGIDKTPLDTQVNLLEKANDGLVLTGNREKLLQLAGINNKVAKQLIVEGNWKSSDGIDVSVSSALVPENEANEYASTLSKTEPFFLWLPTLESHESSEEYQRSNDKEGCEPWIVCPSPSVRLDEDDPLGAHSAMRRPYFKEEIRTLNSLVNSDAFGRSWKDSKGTVVAHAEAWGREFKYEEHGGKTGERLVCTSDFLRKVLVQKQASLVLLINIQQYKDKPLDGEGTFTNSAAVVVITSSLRMTYFPGLINHVLPPRDRAA